MGANTHAPISTLLVDYRESCSLGGSVTIQQPAGNPVPFSKNGLLVTEPDRPVEMELENFPVKQTGLQKPTVLDCDDNDYLVGYDYCGIPQYSDASMSTFSNNGNKNANGFRCSIGALNGHLI